MKKTLLLAEWIGTMDEAVRRAGGVVFAGGKVVAVGDGRELKRGHPDAQLLDAGQAVVLPGLVNAHTHLELSDLECGSPPAGGFVEWIKSIRAKYRGPRTDAHVAAATERGVAQCLKFGVTSVGDISQQSHVTRPILARSPLGGVSYGEVIALGKLREQLGRLLTAAQERTHENGRLKTGVTPHAPYTVEEEVYRACRALAEAGDFPLATHLAESPDEGRFLAEHAGPFRELWEAIGMWSAPATRFAGGPIRYAESLGLLNHSKTVLAHVNYCDDDEMEVLARARASVAYCPRTHAYFGHPPHRWREMLARGINVAVGTDSCASSPDLNLVDDLRLLHRIAPEVPAEVLWALATVRGAKATGQEARVGSIAAGKEADFVVFDVRSEDPLREILENSLLPAQVWAAGRRV